MRIRNIITLLLLPLLATACNTDKGDAEGIVPTPVELVIRASQGVTTRASVVEDPEIVVGADLAADPVAPSTTSLDTRTELGDVTGNELPIHWSGPVESDEPGEDKPGDQIMVWATPNSTNTVGYAFEQTVFSLAHFNYTYSSADFTAVVANTMDEDYTYTYHAIYPSPRSRKLSGSSYTESDVDGITMNADNSVTSVTYSLPTTQTGDYNGAYDIMRGTATGAALNDSSDADNSIWPQPELRMQHLMHLMRIRVPENRNLMGRSIKRLEITFPEAIVGGEVTFNPTDPSVTPIWSGQSTKVTIDFDDTNLLDAAGRDVWIFVKPGTISGSVKFRAYGDDGVPSEAIYSDGFNGRELEAQHITPITLTIPTELEPVVVNFSCPDSSSYPNFLGEAATTMYIHSGPDALAETATSVTSTNGTFGVKFYYVEGEVYPDLVGQRMEVSFASAHADVSANHYTLTIPNMAEGARTGYYALPYLFFEDFNCIVEDQESYGNNDYDSDSDRNQPGAVLNQPQGWNAARFWAKPSTVRINVRWQAAVGFSSTHYGRLDTPPLNKIKSNTPVAVTFNAGANILGTAWASSVGSMQVSLATHTNASNPIDGIPTGRKGLTSRYDTTLDDFGNTHYTSSALGNNFGSDAFNGSYPLHTVKISSASNVTRLCFYPRVSASSSIGTGNAEINIYIDNVKVSVGGTAKHTNLNYRSFFPNHTN